MSFTDTWYCFKAYFLKLQDPQLEWRWLRKGPIIMFIFRQQNHLNISELYTVIALWFDPLDFQIQCFLIDPSVQVIQGTLQGLSESWGLLKWNNKWLKEPHMSISG